MTGKVGSPPHTWRIHSASEAVGRAIRITSTYVENTDCYAFNIIIFRDHLHIRGEYIKLINELGKIIGITSTYVENTAKMKPNTRIIKDHLHIRGEYLIALFIVSLVTGSPPHTWRIPCKTTSRSVSVRITSTYVENTNTPFRIGQPA